MLKENIIYLTDALKQKSGLSYKEVVNEMQSILVKSGIRETFSRHIFDAKFRRFPERKTIYSNHEVLALIKACMVDNQPPCSILEVCLLILWTDVGIKVLYDLGKIFGHNALMQMTMICSRRAAELRAIDWSNASVRKRIEREIGVIPDQHRVTVSGDDTPPSSGRGDTAITDEAVIDTAKSLRKNNQFGAAETLLLSQLQSERDLPPKMQALVNHQLGINAIECNQYERATEYLETAYNLAKGYLPKEIPAILANIGSNEYHKGYYKKAKQYYRQGFIQSIDLKRPDVANFLENALAITLTEEGDYINAERYYVNALALADKRGNNQDKFHNHTHLGMLYYYQGYANEALLHLRRSEELLSQISELPKRLQAQRFMQMLQLNLFSHTKKEQDISVARLKEIVRATESHYLTWYEISIRLDLAKYYANDNFTQAMDEFNNALNIAHNNDMVERMVIALYGKAILLLNKKMPAQAHTIPEITYLLENLLKPLNLDDLRGYIHGEHIERAAQYFQHGFNKEAVQPYPITQSLRYIFTA